MEANSSDKPQDSTSSELEKITLASAKSDLRWKKAKRVFVGAMTVWGTGVYIFMMGKGFDVWGDKNATVAPMVRLVGEIAADSETAGADAVIKHLRNAFAEKKANGVVLYIDTPGGSPSEAERISSFIEEQKSKTGKKVYAVCANMCASAGYMIAIHADEIHAGRYSLIGSIGAVMNSWNFSGAIGKFGLQHNSYASGKLKAMLNPYAPIKREDQEKAQNLVNSMGLTFANDVRKKRAEKLVEKTDLFTGEVWDGNTAKTLGLIDHIGTVDEIIIEKFGDKSQVKEFGSAKHKPNLLSYLLDKATLSIAKSLLQPQ